MINSPFEDPALFVEILWEHRALLFDMGEIGSFRPAKLLKVSHAFVSHTHIDHFVGFDTLVRLMLNREKALKVFGPPGFLANVHGKLAGYTWNLTEGYPFSVIAAEVHPDRILSQTFRSQQRFIPGEQKEEAFTGILEEDSQLKVSAAHLDHFIPSLAFALEERFHINVHKERLSERGLSIGPWLKEMKDALWRGESGDLCLKVPLEGGGGAVEKEFSLDDLKETVTLTPARRSSMWRTAASPKKMRAGLSGWLRGRTCFSARRVSWTGTATGPKREGTLPPARPGHWPGRPK
jgi:ribonuclease Z